MDKVLENALKTGKVAGAYLVQGPSAEAVEAYADPFLQALFCQDKSSGKACGACPGCAKYAARNHADLLLVDSKAATIKVDEVREVLPFAARKPYEGGRKAILIPEAHRMTPQAQNALLKVLEEPPADTVFVLGVHNLKNILPTIISRCIILKARVKGANAAALAKEMDIADVRAHVLMAAAEGDYYLAKKYAQQDYFEVRTDMVTALDRLFRARTRAVSATEKLFLNHEARLPFAMAVAMIYLRDVINCRHLGEDAPLANSDIKKEIKKHAGVPDRVLVNTMNLMARYTTRCELSAGMNKKLVLTGLLFDILEVVL